MAKFNAYTVLCNNSSLTSVNNAFTGEQLATMFNVKGTLAPAFKDISAFQGKIRYRVRKLNNLLLARGMRIVETTTADSSTMTFKVDRLTNDHPYMKYSRTLAANAHARDTMSQSGMTMHGGTWAAMDVKELHLLTKAMYR